MNILLYGATELGYMLAKRLYLEHSVTLIDDLKRMPDKFNNLDLSFVGGSGADIDALEQADVKKCELFIACSGLDEANIVACWTVKKIVDIETICFIRTMELYRNLASPKQDRYLTRYDINTIIWPEQLLTQDIFRIISVPEAIDVEYFAEGRAKLFEYRIKEDSVLCDHRVMDCSFPPDVLIVGITRENQLFIPNGSTIILEDDKIIFMGTNSALDSLAATIFQSTEVTKTAVLIGGGSVGFMLAQKLEQTGIRVKIIEHDQARCEFLADNLKKSLILHGDGTDLELLEGESVDNADVVVCITNNDEKNLLCSLLVKQLAPTRRIITRVKDARTGQLFEKVGIDVTVSPRDSALKELLNRVQARNVDILALVEGGQGEVLRLTLPENFPETKVIDLKFEVQAIIGIVKRGRSLLIPTGNTVLQAGDQIKVFTMADDAEIVKMLFS
ncbi:K+ transport system, NAD-binding component [Desulfocapsa sulfexigens DSM 10523]|uniref:Trk system potassium uptake protein TrkA n=1 Tax=Desulfocapsa sulfexigens (strain DSM 10523 / SB164P1) TaxID=1167006 RepID=M1P7E6_DESSD|nr:Trk system potassium transporter TrkA [Desulfocapsa sulfexigens]AGF77617.1 K+ transport system, NAD-binding component [Desulfocapsa sulfexigens DSM 10523]